MKAFREFTIVFAAVLFVGLIVIFQPTRQQKAEQLERIKKENANYAQKKYNQARARQARDARQNLIHEAKYQESLGNR